MVTACQTPLQDRRPPVNPSYFKKPPCHPDTNMSKASSHTSPQGRPDIHEQRKMLSLTNNSEIKIITQLQPGTNTYGALACCHAPECCWCLSAIPCCKKPKKVLDTMEDSKYVYVRENSVEWNQPEITFADCNCCIPINPCKLSVVDNVQTVYFDNPTMDKLENKTRCCNDTRTWCCGGQGQRLRLANEFCGGMCLAGKNGVCCCPVCLPEVCTRPCTQQHNIYVEDADQAKYEIQLAKANAKARMGMD